MCEREREGGRLRESESARERQTDRQTNREGNKEKMNIIGEGYSGKLFVFLHEFPST